MGTTANKLLAISNSKVAIRDAIVAKGVAVPVGTTFMDYAGKINSITTGGSPTADPYVRPSTWLDLPDNVAGVEKVSILYALFDISTNMVAFTCQAAYTVDWGDGTSDNYTSGTKALHTYDYSTSGGAFVEGEIYKQVIITITPQSGAHLTYVNLNQTHTTLNNVAGSTATSGIQDVRINSSYLYSLYIGSSNNSTQTINYAMVLFEQCIIGEVSTSFINAGYLFANCYALENVVFNFNTAQITNWTSTFSSCFRLQKAPSIQFPATSIIAMNMFTSCRVLKEVPDITFNSTNTSSMFNSCTLLQSVKITFTNTADIIASYMFLSCSSLVDVELTFTSTGGLNQCSNMFQNCFGLVNAPDIPYLRAVSLNSLYANCYSLRNISDIEISTLCTDISSMFINCYTLQKAPNIIGVTTGIVSLTSVFSGCISLVNIPNYYYFPNVTSMNSTFNDCKSLTSSPNIITGTLKTNTFIFNNCYALSRLTLPLKQTFSTASAKMSASALNEMYTALPTVDTTQIVTVAGNYGATSTPIIGLTGTTTNGSKVISMDNTTGLSVGMFASGTSTSTTGFGVTLTTGVVSIASHGLINGDIVSFSAVGGVVGITLNTIYYVVNADIDTFQISLSVGGPAIVVTGNGGGTCKTPAFITAINSNTNVTISTPVVNSGGTYTLSFRSNTHKTYLATMKNWTVTG